MPYGTNWYRNVSCETASELGVSHAWLPVVHTYDLHQKWRLPGVWLYYARGCSDLLWNVGRTLLALNKVHAAVLLLQRQAVHQSRETTNSRERQRGPSVRDEAHGRSDLVSLPAPREEHPGPHRPRQADARIDAAAIVAVQKGQPPRRQVHEEAHASLLTARERECGRRLLRAV